MRRLVLFAALSLASTALAANPKASALAKDADRLYKDNRYKEAAETLREAYEADPTGLCLYNIARAYDQGVEAGGEGLGARGVEVAARHGEAAGSDAATSADQ